jgi:hypothetical protein
MELFLSPVKVGVQGFSRLSLCSFFLMKIRGDGLTPPGLVFRNLMSFIIPNKFKLTKNNFNKDI